jgi:uncharacterized membrane protein
MTPFPPIPAFDDSHALIVHFPIALLLVAPIFIVAGLLFKRVQLPMFISSLVLFVLGSISAVLATSSGEAAAEAVNLPATMKAVVEDHEELAELSRNLFIGLTGLVGALALVSWKVTGTIRTPLVLTLSAASLLFYAGSALVLANAAHQGGRLVHEMGLRGPMFGPTAPTPSTAPGRDRDD